MKITPAHDFNDFEVGSRHDLPLVNVLDAEASSPSRTTRHFGRPGLAELERPSKLHGVNAFAARKKM